MSIRSTFARLRDSLTGGLGGGTKSAGVAGRMGIRSPWSTGVAGSLVMGDIFGTEALPISRAEAMSIPAVAKARHLVCTVLPQYPLVQYKNAAATSDEEQPAWLNSTDSQTSPVVRLLWTLDDLFFGGWSLWQVERGALGQILDAVRVPPEGWAFDASGGRVVIRVDGEVAEAADVILFSGPFEGMCEAASRTMRGAVAIERAWIGRAESPIPAIDIHQNTDDELTKDEIKELVEEWVVARTDPRGAVTYSPHNVDIRALGEVDPQLFIEGRNAIRLDVANFAGVPANYLEGSLATASLTYSTQDGNRNELVDLALGMWRGAIESRLSMDDVTPPGTRIAFDLSALVDLPQAGESPARLD